MEKLIFIFSSPEGGGEEVASSLKDFTILRDKNAELWELYRLQDKFAAKSFQGFGNKLLESYFFDETVKNVAFLDFKMGMNYGFGLKMWVFLKLNFDCKFIFCHKPFEHNLISIFSNKQNWIPNYGTCLSDCEQKLKNQINQFEKFSNFYKKQSLLVNSTDGKDFIDFIYG